MSKKRHVQNNCIPVYNLINLFACIKHKRPSRVTLTRSTCTDLVKQLV